MKKWLAIVLCIVFAVSSLFLVSCQKQEEATSESGGYGEKAEEAGGYGGEEAGGYGGEETGGYGGEETGGYGGEETGGYGNN